MKFLLNMVVYMWLGSKWESVIKFRWLCLGEGVYGWAVSGSGLGFGDYIDFFILY